MVRFFRYRFFAVSAVILLALVVLSNLSPRAEGGEPQGSLILEPQLVNMMQGYGFNMNLTIQNVTNLAFFGTHLDFNTNRISMQTYSSRDGWSMGCTPSSAPHEGVYCSGPPPGESFTGSAVVLTISFRCEDAGSSQITVSSSPGWTEAPYGAEWHDFAVTQGATVNQAAPVTVTSTVTETTTISNTTTTTEITTETTTETSVSTNVRTVPKWTYTIATWTRTQTVITWTRTVVTWTVTRPTVTTTVRQDVALQPVYGLAGLLSYSDLFGIVLGLMLVGGIVIPPTMVRMRRNESR